MYPANTAFAVKYISSQSIVFDGKPFNSSNTDNLYAENEFDMNTVFIPIRGMSEASQICDLSG
ncbi:hypothetical protein BN1200_190037 [Klebsiella variicola]|nr:hypothetical protein BN1200_190037 [Klebsiella variicola]